jgi:hypothetical protein
MFVSMISIKRAAIAYKLAATLEVTEIRHSPRDETGQEDNVLEDE